jgi:hypothetical protein
MPLRFITKSIHTNLIDYPVAIVLMVAPFLLKLGKSSPPALTDYPTGLVRVIRYWVDRALGVSPSLPSPLSISPGLTPATTGFSPLRSCRRPQFSTCPK